MAKPYKIQNSQQFTQIKNLLCKFGFLGDYTFNDYRKNRTILLIKEDRGFCFKNVCPCNLRRVDNVDVFINELNKIKLKPKLKLLKR